LHRYHHVEESRPMHLAPILPVRSVHCHSSFSVRYHSSNTLSRRTQFESASILPGWTDAVSRAVPTVGSSMSTTFS
jgi:hypothetical protein